MTMSTTNLEIHKFNSILEYKHKNPKTPTVNLEIFYQNVRSLKNKFEVVELVIEKYHPDVTILTETWITKDQKKILQL